MRSAVVALAATLLSLSNAARDGTVCVDADLVVFFDLFNDLRANGASSDLYSLLVAADTEYTASDYFTIEDGSFIYLSNGQSSITDAIAEIDAFAGGSPSLSWSEGMTAATVEMTTEW